MKKILSALFALVLVVSMCAVSVSAIGEEMTVLRGTPVIDGTIDAVWASADRQQLSHLKAGDLKGDGISYDRLKVDSLEDSIKYLFKTDHHWNAFGMYTAYCDIVSMIYGEDADDIIRPLGERYDIEDADFYGTFARTSGYYGYHDDFFFYDYDLPPHTLKADYPYSFNDVKAKYSAGKFSKDISADHYVNFYPYARYLRYPTNDTGRIVLVLGDSYSRGISELLGSAFDEAYIFDYRRIHEIGNYNDFIEKNRITDVLFMQYSLRGVFDNQNDNSLDTIILD